MSLKQRSMRPSVMKLAGPRSALHVVRLPEQKVFQFIPSEHGYNGKPVPLSYEEVKRLVKFLEDETDEGGTVLAEGSIIPRGLLPGGQLQTTCPGCSDPSAFDVTAPETCLQRPRSHLPDHQ